MPPGAVAAINYPSMKQTLKNKHFTGISRRSEHFYQLPVNSPSIRGHAQNGKYFIKFRGASFSNGLITASSTASRIYRETAALFLSSTPNLSRRDALITGSQ
jgi:hypothetical protein